MPFRRLVVGAIVASIATLHAAGTVMSQDAAAAPSKQDIGYFLGMSVGQQLLQQGFTADDLTVEGLTSGLTDALSGQEVSLSDDQLRAVAQQIEKMLVGRQQVQMEERKKMGVANLEKGKLFLEENAKKEGVKQLASGLQYKVNTAGEGSSPSAEDTVTVHYTGRLIDGKVFDSSVDRGEPATFSVGQVIPGWRQALQEMKVGDKWTLYIPAQLAYGAQGSPGGIGPNEVLVFEVELLDIAK